METTSSKENNNGEVDNHDGRRFVELQETVEIVTVQEFSQLLVSEPKKLHLEPRQRRRRIQKVTPQLRLRRQRPNEHLYDPVMVSLGPYHHGQPELQRAEEFKYLCLDWCARGDEEKKAFFYNKILEKIKVIRDCYAEVTILEKYDDKALALMMLLDGCIIINFMHNCIYMNRNNYFDWHNFLGAAGSNPFMFRDIIVMENQIPFQILQLLISLQYEEENAEWFLERFLSHVTSRDLNQIKIRGEKEEPPIHLLEACWRGMTTNNKKGKLMPEVHNRLSEFRWPKLWMRQMRKNKTHVFYSHRSVTDLKAKGIRVTPHSSPFLRDIKFTSHAFYGKLQLPAYPISNLSPIFFSNLIAYEVSPNSNASDLVVLSYVILMKSLIQGPEDVKELQQKGVLMNRFANLEKGVKLFKEIDTLGFQDDDMFMEVKQKIEKHCNSKAKTWIADLIHTRFRTPWTAVALFAALLLLCLTFLQTFFTIRPVK